MINNVTLMGRLVADPEVKKTSSDIAVCNFTIAIDRDYQKQGEDRKADFIRIQTWRGTAEFTEKYFHKGDMISVVGAIQTDTYEDKDGNKRTMTQVVANKISFCGGKKAENNAPANAPAGKAAPEEDFEEIVDDDDLPF